MEGPGSELMSGGLAKCASVLIDKLYGSAMEAFSQSDVNFHSRWGDYALSQPHVEYAAIRAYATCQSYTRVLHVVAYEKGNLRHPHHMVE